MYWSEQRKANEAWHHEMRREAEAKPVVDHHDKPTCSDCGTVQGTGHMNWCPRRGDARDDYQGPSLNQQQGG
jgi:hypothetical protein